ncbi:GTP cyclohydrolase II [Cytospora paraplurivora]|uniref:GTP cyclohydrolase II n=1 Tax=Cytospora paraplurivora TaxID=2898453 RepID=A0AAN9UAF4_9PEZI
MPAMQAPKDSGTPLPSFYSPRTTARDGDIDAEVPEAALDGEAPAPAPAPHSPQPSTSKPEEQDEALTELPPPPSLLSPSFTPPSTPGAATPTTTISSITGAPTAPPTTLRPPRAIPVDSSLPDSASGCGPKRPRLVERLPQVECIVRARIPTVAGTEMFLHLYTNDVDNKEHLAIVFGENIRSRSLDAPRPGETEHDRMVRGAYVGRLFPGRATSGMAGGPAEGKAEDGPKSHEDNIPLVRIHSECYTGETAWSARCDCGEQLDEAARLMSLPTNTAGGIIIYLRQEGRGIGLGEKLKAYNLQDLGNDTVEANLLLRHPADARSYGLATAILSDLGQREIKLLTNNPDKIRAVEGPNREVVVKERVEMVPLSWRGRGGFRSKEVEGYLKTKALKFVTGVLNRPKKEAEMDKSLRLRLVVRRNGLPDSRILFNIPLAHDPTIANLVELVNDTIPLETEEWGLEDYAVELHDKDGHAFECLHFQPVASLLDKDDQVFIRPILTNELKKRRLSGRVQIAHSGQHLVDGVPYGRPRLRAPRGRPAVHIAPRKRRRLTYDGDFDQDDFEEDYLDDDDDDEQGIVELYTGARESQPDKEDGQRLLTQNGEPALRNSSRRVRFPHNVTGGGPRRDADVHVPVNIDPEDGENEDEDGSEDEVSDSESEEYDQDDIQEELKGLSEEAAANGPTRRDGQERVRFHAPREEVSEQVKGRSTDFCPSSDGGQRQQHPVQYSPESVESRGKLDLKLLDKITAIRSAFPAVSTVKCEELLTKHNRDVSSVWKKLARQVKPRLDLAHTMVLNTQLELPNEFQVMSSPPRKPAEVPGEVSRIEDDEDDEDDMPGGPSGDEEREEHAEEPESTSEGEQDDENNSENDNDGTFDDVSQPAPLHTGHDDSSSVSSSSESESDESESESRKSSSTQAGKQRREQAHDSDSDSSSDDSSDSGTSSEDGLGNQRRNVTRPSPQKGQLSTGRAGTACGASRASGKAASPLIETDSSSEEESSEARVEGVNGGSRLASSSSSDSDSDTDSSTDSSTSSESESDAQPSAFTRTNKAPVKPRTACAPTATSAKPPPPSTASHAPPRIPVPPGQGLTKTQRRNARRRLQKQRRAASSGEAAPEDTGAARTSDADLVAKKSALLRSLGTSDLPNGRSEKAAEKNNVPPSPAMDGRIGHMDTEEDPEAWKQKISYRAVECVNEGVELSQPPFPFVQRWDPQQRQRRGKRKSRDDTQFYDETDQHGTKKRKVGPPRQPLDHYQENVTLNYDDIAFNAEEHSTENDRDAGRAEPDQVAEDEDDLPALPADLASIPSLRPEDLKPDMVVAWKQLMVSKATNWQPTLSDFLTAVVLEVEEGGQLFKVQLAKRDRDVDKTEKEYDEEGHRIYGKLEAPDDDEAELDMGFRDMSFAEMMDPRVVQQPALPVTAEKAPQLPELDTQIAESQPQHKEGEERRDSSESNENTSSSHSNQLATLDDESDGHGQAQKQDGGASTVHLRVSQSPDAIQESFVTATNHDMDIGDGDRSEDEFDISAELINPDEQVSISDKRREEISQLINNGGFRQELRTSIDQSAFLRFGSPSRQLQEEASSILFSRQVDSPQRFSSEEAPSEYDSKDPSQDDSLPPAPEPARDIFHSAPQTHGPALNHEGTSGPANSAGGVEYPNLSFTSQMSPGNGRQFDPNFVMHSDDLGIEPPEDSVLMGGFEDDNNAMDDSNGPDASPGDNNHGDQARTPTQQTYNDDVHHATSRQTANTPLKSMQLNPKDHGSPGSADSNSTRSSSIFLDLELLGSQPAKIKFPEQVKEEPMTLQENVRRGPLSQPAQRMAQLPKADKEKSLPAVNSKSPGKGSKSSIAGTPRRSQRTHRLSLFADLPSSPSAMGIKSPERGLTKGANGITNPNGNAKPLVASFDASVSPPTRSKLRQHKGSASPATRSQGKGEPFRAATQKDVVSSFEQDDPLAEVEPAYTEMYADDDVDEDYTDTVASMKKLTRRLPSSRAERGASLPLAETDAANERDWVPSTYL